MLYLMLLIIFLCKLSESTILDCSRTRSCPGNEFHCECQTFAALRWTVRLPDGMLCMNEYGRGYAVGVREPLDTCPASVILSNQTNYNFTSSLDINLTNQTTVSCQGGDGTKTLTLNATSECQNNYSCYTYSYSFPSCIMIYSLPFISDELELQLIKWYECKTAMGPSPGQWWSTHHWLSDLHQLI